MEKRKVQEAVTEWLDLKRRRMEDGADEGEGDVDDEDVQDVQARVRVWVLTLSWWFRASRVQQTRCWYLYCYCRSHRLLCTKYGTAYALCTVGRW